MEIEKKLLDGKNATQSIDCSEIKRLLEQVAKEYKVKILFCVESGSRAWGMESADSDYDIRFVFYRTPEEYTRINSSGFISITQATKIWALEEEIATMPHYECWNESFEGFINKSEMIDRECFYHLAYSEEDLGRVTCYFDGWTAECKNDICYVNDTREFCKLNKEVIRDGGDE